MFDVESNHTSDEMRIFTVSASASKSSGSKRPFSPSSYRLKRTSSDDGGDSHRFPTQFGSLEVGSAGPSGSCKQDFSFVRLLASFCRSFRFHTKTSAVPQPPNVAALPVSLILVFECTFTRQISPPHLREAHPERENMVIFSSLSHRSFVKEADGSRTDQQKDLHRSAR